MVFDYQHLGLLCYDGLPARGQVEGEDFTRIEGEALFGRRKGRV